MTNDSKESQSVVRVIVLSEDEHERIDRFLAKSSELSRSRIKSLIQQGLCSRNGQFIRDPSTSVKDGDVLEYYLPSVKNYRMEAQKIDLEILFEDEDVIVLNKAAGMVVHPAPGNEDGTLVNALLAHCGESLPGIGGEKRPGIVHRLDKDTSGVMVVAKTEQALTALSADFSARRIERFYYALCWGSLSPVQGVITGAIGRDPYDRKRMTVVKRGGKLATTHYSTVQAFNTTASLLQCKLDTGRTHQIRVHLSQSGHPLIGDPIYLRRVPAVAKQLPHPQKDALLDFPRQALHAALLGFCHPRTGEWIRFESNLPLDMKDLIQILSNL